MKVSPCCWESRTFCSQWLNLKPGVVRRSASTLQRMPACLHTATTASMAAFTSAGISFFTPTGTITTCTGASFGGRRSPASSPVEAPGKGAEWSLVVLETSTTAQTHLRVAAQHLTDGKHREHDLLNRRGSNSKGGVKSTHCAS